MPAKKTKDAQISSARPRPPGRYRVLLASSTSVSKFRDALWQAECVGRLSGPLFEASAEAEMGETEAPLFQMTIAERLMADFHGTGLTVGRHPVSYHRVYLNEFGIVRASDLIHLPHGRKTRIGGTRLVAQRPGSVNRFDFLSLEDETGISTAIISSKLFGEHRTLASTEKFLMVAGKLQNLDGVLSIKAFKIQPLVIRAPATPSHDFH